MFNVLRQPARAAFRDVRRCYATAFVPPASVDRHMDSIESRPRRQKPSPASPTFYTARASYYDQMNTLETAISHTRQALQTLQLLPLPKFARDALPPLQPIWKTKDSLATALDTRLTTSRYRRFVNLLNQLNNYRRIADVSGCADLAHRVGDILALFERENKEALLARGKRKPVNFDIFGRSYTVGRRKESAARVWIIPVQDTTKSTTSEEKTTEAQEAAPPAPSDASVETMFGLEPSASPSYTSATAAPVKVTTTQILVNNVPLSQYFPLAADRERVVRPFKVAGLLGAYNAFVIVRGGGTTGQSGAISVGIAKGLAAHVPEVEVLLRKAKLTRRDPRMVERKKTGLAKARKAYTWVKR